MYWNLLEFQEHRFQIYHDNSGAVHYLRLMFNTSQCIGKREALMTHQRHSHLDFVGVATIDKILNYKPLTDKEEQIAIQSVVHHYSQDRAIIKKQLTFANKLYYWTTHKA